MSGQSVKGHCSNVGGCLASSSTTRGIYKDVLCIYRARFRITDLLRTIRWVLPTCTPTSCLLLTGSSEWNGLIHKYGTHNAA